AFHNLGVTLFAQKKHAEAVAALRSVLRLRPDLPEAYNNLGVVLAARQQLPEAVAAFRKAVELSPDHPVFRKNLRVAQRGREPEKKPPATRARREQPRGAPERPLDLIPADASFGLMVKSVAGARDKGDRFFKDNDVDTARVPLPTDLFKGAFE